ncbi:MAG: hypothetical protein Q9221_007941 [Calogaya cf. arnoldii]
MTDLRTVSKSAVDDDEPKKKEHLQAGERLLKDHQEAAKIMNMDKSPERTVLAFPLGTMAIVVKNYVVSQWTWTLRNQLNDRSLYQLPSNQKFLTFLREHRAAATLLITCQILDIDRHAAGSADWIRQQWPNAVEWGKELVEFAIGLIPRRWTRSFGRPIDPATRAIMAASVLVPVAHRFAKGGRALYSAAKLSELLGKTSEEAVRIIRKLLAQAANASISISDLRRLADARSAFFSRPVFSGSNMVDTNIVYSAMDSMEKMWARRGAIQPLFKQLTAKENE